MTARAKDLAGTSHDDLPVPSGWPAAPGRLSRWAGHLIGVVVVAVFAVATLGALGATPADLHDPGALAARVVALLRAGPVPWTGAVGTALLLLAPAVTAGAPRIERERLVELGPGRWALRVAVAPAALWRTAISGLGGTCLILVWASDVVGGPAFLTVLLGAVAVVGVGQQVLRATVAAVAPHRREGVDLTSTGLEYRTLRRTVTVDWADVGTVEARARRRGENGPRPEIVLHRRDGGREVVILPAAFPVPPARLFWACVAFLDPHRREALLDGAELTPPPGH